MRRTGECTFARCRASTCIPFKGSKAVPASPPLPLHPTVALSCSGRGRIARSREFLSPAERRSRSVRPRLRSDSAGIGTGLCLPSPLESCASLLTAASRKCSCARRAERLSVRSANPARWRGCSVHRWRPVPTAEGWNRAVIVVQSLRTSERKILVEGGADGRYVPTGHIVYAVGGTLFAVPFDLRRQEVTSRTDRDRRRGDARDRGRFRRRAFQLRRQRVARLPAGPGRTEFGTVRHRLHGP